MVAYFFVRIFVVLIKKQQFLAMPALSVQEQTELCMQIQTDRTLLPAGALSSTHVMSLHEYVNVMPFIFSYDSVQVTYNRNITNLEEQVIVVIGV